MINKKTLWLAIVLSTLSSGDVLASKDKNLETPQFPETSITNKSNDNLVDILRYVNFKNFKNPEELIAFYRMYISEGNDQLSVYKKMRKVFDKTLLDIIELSNEYKKNDNSYLYQLDCLLNEEDKVENVSSVSINFSLEKDSHDENIYIPKLSLIKNFKNNMSLTFVLKPELSISRDRRSYVWNDKKDRYQVLLLNFIFEAYSEQNVDKKKTIFIEDISIMKENIKNFQERINSLKKQKKQEKLKQKKGLSKEKKIKKSELRQNKNLEKTLEKKPINLENTKVISSWDKNSELDKKTKNLSDLNSITKVKEKNSIKNRKVLETMLKVAKNNRETLRELLRVNWEVLRSWIDKNRESIKEVFDLNKESNQKNIKIISDEDIENIKDLEKF